MTQVHVVPGAGAWLVKLAGIIDETFDRTALGLQLERCTVPIVFDLDGVKRITSFGVREWIETLKALPIEPYYFIRCRPAIVSQFNMVANFGWAGQMVSLYCPYVCPECERELELLVDLRHQHELVVQAKPPELTCPDCKIPAEFDDIAEAYFAFAQGTRPPVLSMAADLLVDRLLGRVGTPRGVPLKVEKEVEGRITAIWLSGSVDKAARFKRLADGLEGQVVLIGQGIGEVTPEGLRRLRELCCQPGFDLYLARMPLALAREFSADGGWGKSRLLSVLWPRECATCGHPQDLEIDAGERDALVAGRAVPRPCTFCTAPLRSSPEDEAVVTLRHLPLSPAPAEVHAYLTAHRQPPIRTGAGPQEVRSGIGTGVRPKPGALPDGSSGRTQLGRYHLLHPLGTGGMAEVYLGRQMGPEGFAKNVVVKRILPQFANDPHFVSMFLEEARVAARISHSNVVQIFDLGKAGDDYYIVMEYVRGWNLNDILRHLTAQNQPMPVELGLRIVSDVCAGLWAAHSAVDDAGRPQVIVHRDVSPHNILISADGQVKLSDFGIAKAVGSVGNTRTGSLKGKVLYMAPETIREEKVDPRADLFAAGLVLFYCLALRHPFEGKTEYQVLHALLTTDVPDVSLYRSGLPEEVTAIVRRAVARDKEQRFESAQEMQLALERALVTLGQPATSAHLSFWLSQVLGDVRVPGTTSDPSITVEAGGARRQSTRNLSLAVTEPGSSPGAPGVNDPTVLHIESLNEK